MRLRGLLALAVVALLTCHSEIVRADDLTSNIYPGLVLSAGGVYSSRGNNATNPGVGSGLALDADYTHIVPNVGVSYKSFGGGVLNGYAGVGVSGLLQLQVGYGNCGFVKRIRSDININRLFEFVYGRRTNRFNTSFGDRFTFSIAAEEYTANPQYNNVAFGLGLLY